MYHPRLRLPGNSVGVRYRSHSEILILDIWIFLVDYKIASTACLSLMPTVRFAFHTIVLYQVILFSTILSFLIEPGSFTTFLLK